MPDTALIISAGTYPIEFAIAAWLHAKHSRSQSARTREEYANTLASFRRTVRAALGEHADLDWPDSTQLATIVQAWASSPRTRDGRAVSPATANLRLSAVSSFYRYARRMGYLPATVDNPVDRIDRPAVQTYAAARPIAPRDVATRMAAIETDTAIGRRDKALLAIAFATGRRLSEIAQLQLGDVTGEDPRQLTLTFRRAKGGKVMVDTLPSAVSALLAEYIRTDRGQLAADCPLWVSYSGPTATRGGALGARAVEHIAARRLGVSRFHATRHTFAHTMEDAGAKASDIQARLGHSSLAVTGRYLAALRSADNPYGEAVAAALGLA